MSRRVLAATFISLMALASIVPMATANSPHNPKARIQAGNASCGADLTGLPVIGFTNYHRQGDRVSINYHLKHALAKATYTVELWGDSCTFFGAVAMVKTNKHGVGNGSGSVVVPSGSTRFFATALGPNGFNDTPAVTLLP